MAIKRRPGSTKSPPIFSHEFIIQNHADIVSCVAMLIVIALLFQATSPIATTFVALQHNITESFGTPFVLYSTGPKDAFIVFFYFLISIVIHAVVQEYLLDKINRKLHLSKTKHSKFNESGQLLLFFLISLAWACEVIRRDGYLFSISRIWTDYPARHVEMTYLLKFYFIIQIAYWLHAYPELYFQKVKRDEIGTQITYISLYLIFFTAAYCFNFTRVAICLSVLHYSAEALFHVSRLLYFSNKTKVYKYTFNVWNILFVLTRLASITLSVLTFWYGFGANSSNSVNFSEGNFNTPTLRLATLSGVCLLQAWMMWNFITFHLRRLREKANELARRKKNSAGTRKQEKQLLETEESELPEVDQLPAKKLSKPKKMKMK